MKQHYKLYKAGKLWLTAAITTLAMGMTVSVTNAHAADNVAPAQATTATVNADGQSQKGQILVNKDQTAVGTKDDAAKSTTATDPSKSVTNNDKSTADQTNTGDKVTTPNKDTTTPGNKGNQDITPDKGTGDTNKETTTPTKDGNKGNQETTPSKDNTKGDADKGTTDTNKGTDTANKGTDNTDKGTSTDKGDTTKGDQTGEAGKTDQQTINGFVNKNNVWQDAKGQLANGWQLAGNDWYYFQKGIQSKGWQSINNNWYYLNPTTAIMESGIQKIDGKYYYLNDVVDGSYGVMKTGWQNVKDDWYYFQDNGVALVGWQKLNNKWYYMKPDTAVMETGIQKINNNFYYLNTQSNDSLGAMKTGWQFVDGHWYGFKGDGSAYLSWNKISGSTYYFDPENAQMATGDTLIKDNHYYFDTTSGHQLTGLLVDRNDHLLKYFDPQTGVRQTKFTSGDHTYTFDEKTGGLDTTSLLDGLNTIAGRVLDFNTATKTFVTNAWKQIKGAWYYFGANGLAMTDWYQSPAGNWYFFNTDGTAKTGWYKTAAGFWYYFDPTNAWALTGWQKLNNKWYHFDEKNANATTGWYQTAAGFWYYFDPTNAWATTGWRSIDGHWYLFNATNANAVTGWYKTAAGYWYYMDPVKAWAVTGYYIINNVEYYFDPTDAYLYQNRWVNVDGWTYHADDNGRLWFPQWYSQFTPNFVAEGSSIYSLAIMLSPKEYINIPYALGLLQQDQSGDIYSGSGFSKIIQPGDLVTIAHQFDSSVRDISGSGVQDIINLVNSGHPVQYYGYSAYENTNWARNHNKVIVGYQNGYFRVYDPCYWYASEGSSGRNAYDYGAKSWISVSQFTKEYAGQAITVD